MPSKSKSEKNALPEFVVCSNCHTSSTPVIHSHANYYIMYGPHHNSNIVIIVNSCDLWSTSQNLKTLVAKLIIDVRDHDYKIRKELKRARRTINCYKEINTLAWEWFCRKQKTCTVYVRWNNLLTSFKYFYAFPLNWLTTELVGGILATLQPSFFVLFVGWDHKRKGK